MMLEIGPRFRTEKESSISQALAELFKWDWSIHSLSEISERFLASWTKKKLESLKE